jgi:hypothetical protein
MTLFLAVQGTSVVAETYPFLNVSIETAAEPLKLKRLKIVVAHAEMPEDAH